MNTHYRIIETNGGFVGIVASDRGLRRVYLPEQSRASAVRGINKDFADTAEDERLMPELAGDIARFFLGESVEFDVRFDWSGYGSFEVDVWRACSEIEYGSTGSYKSLSERVGRPGGARAVGNAMGRNPFPIVVPCHRVVKSDGSLGGYSGPGGVDFKRQLLEMEAETAGAVC